MWSKCPKTKKKKINPLKTKNGSDTRKMYLIHLSSTIFKDKSMVLNRGSNPGSSAFKASTLPIVSFCP